MTLEHIEKEWKWIKLRTHESFKKKSTATWYLPDMWELIDAKCKKFDVVVELGAYIGEWIAGLLDRFPVGNAFCVDPWDTPYTGVGGLDLLAGWMKRFDKQLWKTVHPLRGKSEEWAHAFPYWIDLLFIDAEHTYDAHLKDLVLWYPKLRPGGLLIAHDAHFPCIRNAALDVLGFEPELFNAGPRKKRGSRGYGVYKGYWAVKP